MWGEGATGMAKLFGIKIVGYEPNPPQQRFTMTQ
jgi:hypothetical protein